MSAPKVSIILGSKSDMHIARDAAKVLDEHGVAYDLQVLSAHRDPEKLEKYLEKCRSSVIIAIAGLSAALPGVVSSKTNVPVIGVPVAAVGIDNGKNAALLALRILGLKKK